MSRDENPPFVRGKTLYDGETIDTGDLLGLNIEGAEWVFEDVHPTTGIERTNRPVRCRAVRNSAAIALLPSRLAKFENGALEHGSRVDGYAIATAAGTPEAGYPIDEYLPAAGCPINDICWVVIEGPANVITSLADMASDLVIGGWAVAVTAATSGATTAGRVIPQLLTGATAPLASNIQNRIGRALSLAATTAAGNVVLDIGKW